MREDVYKEGGCVRACVRVHALRCEGNVQGRETEEERDEGKQGDSNQGHTQILC